MNESSKNLHIPEMTTYQAGIAQSMMHRNIQKVSSSILKPYGISKMQWMIVGAILDAGKEGIRMSDLAKVIGVTIPYLTNTLYILEAKEYIQSKSNTQDKRSRIVYINPKKREQCHAIERDLREGLRKVIYSRVSSDDFRTYMKVLLKLQGVGGDQ